MKALRIATRGSALALWQANHIRERLMQLHGVESELIRIRTSGDRFQGASVAQVSEQTGTKGIFIKELEEALLAGTADLAVHSMKDVPTENPAGLIFPAITKREDVRDCLISRDGAQAERFSGWRADWNQQLAAASATAASPPGSWSYSTCEATWIRG